ncbi:hypothetical protein [Streptomyces chiangmaiensis]|nr:hypothetical protein [Streptomyces chiangmaiensis]
MQLTDDEWGFNGPYLPIGEYGPYPKRLPTRCATALPQALLVLTNCDDAC